MGGENEARVGGENEARVGGENVYGRAAPAPIYIFATSAVGVLSHR